ncbi:MAG: hypothetical protein GWN94_19780, partial [Phycisphaerae bacterium]|nr:hypothetical protein [Phycisphaerae bacterium]NIS53314.1 hypothetical protein [Phycisphaerae bacterium]NIX30468.1 hypothetical protein [Phycisphaerae bacterium]
DFFNELKRPRVDALARYYEKAEGELEKVVRGNKKYPMPNLFNRNSHVALWLNCVDADRIIEEAGLKNPLFTNEKKAVPG